MPTDAVPPPGTGAYRRLEWSIRLSTMQYGISDLLYANSFMLLYLAILGIPSERILVWLALPSVLKILTLVPFAQWTERIGKVRLGAIGISFGSLSLVLLIAAGSAPGWAVESLTAMAMVCVGLGSGMYMNAWFPLISDIVPDGQRGRFFGMLRFLYQTASIVFALIASWSLERHSTVLVFQIFLGVALVLRVAGTVQFARIPEVRRVSEGAASLRDSLVAALRHAGYLPFCAYVFLLSLFTGSCTTLFSLLAKDTLLLPQSQVLVIGNCATFGSLVGFLVSGRLIDRIGTKAIFVLCHFSFALVLLAFLGRELPPVHVGVVIGALSVLFGLVQAASSVAMTTEMLSAIPVDNKPMATAVNQSLAGLGIALSGICSSALLKIGVFSQTWSLFGLHLGPYDAILMLSGIMVMLLVVTLGLVPSVMRVRG